MTARHTWEEVCARAIRQFGGETPGAELEAEIMAAWETNHLRVNGAIDRTAALLKAGKVQSGWAVLRAELRKHGPERKKRAKATRPIGERGFATEQEQLENMQQAEEEALQRARTFVAANRCACGRVSPPWFRKCPHCQISAAGGETDAPAGSTTDRTDAAVTAKAAAEPVPAAAYDPGDDL